MPDIEKVSKLLARLRKIGDSDTVRNLLSSARSRNAATRNTVDASAAQGIDMDELRMRQRWAESSFNDKAVSRVGAKGAFQIMPRTYDEYRRKMGEDGDLLDPEYNGRMRDAIWNDLYNSYTAITGNPTDTVRTAKALAMYNRGRGAVGRWLEKQKAAGTDIYGSTEWIDDMPWEETRNYVNFILHGKDVGGNLSNEAYEAGKVEHGYSEGGGIHIKPSHRGRLTELKARTGKTEAELYSDGNPDHKKMVVFARNARKWSHSHGDGGSLEVPEDTDMLLEAVRKEKERRLYAKGGNLDTPETEGGYTSPEEEREKINAEWDPATGFNLFGYLYSRANGNQSHGEENEYWRAYLGLDNNVPAMRPLSKTEWDDEVEKQKAVDGKPSSDFYGTTGRMDQMIQVIADTLNTGKMLRNYDEYKKAIPDLAPKNVIRHMYNQGKNVMDNPDEWVQVKEGPQMYLFDSVEEATNEKAPLGMLADFGMKWNPSEKKLKVHDTYDFPGYVMALSDIPERPKEMKIRGEISYDPDKGSVLLRDGNVSRDKMDEPVADKKSH